MTHQQALVAALVELERQIAQRILVIRPIIEADGTESSRIIRGSFQGEKQ